MRPRRERGSAGRDTCTGRRRSGTAPASHLRSSRGTRGRRCPRAGPSRAAASPQGAWKSTSMPLAASIELDDLGALVGQDRDPEAAALERRARASRRARPRRPGRSQSPRMESPLSASKSCTPVEVERQRQAPAGRRARARVEPRRERAGQLDRSLADLGRLEARDPEVGVRLGAELLGDLDVGGHRRSRRPRPRRGVLEVLGPQPGQDVALAPARRRRAPPPAARSETRRARATPRRASPRRSSSAGSR